MKTKNKMIAFGTAGIFVLVGLYNAVVINSQSNLSSNDMITKRIDEVYGVTIPGREVAGMTAHWKKIQPTKVIVKDERPSLHDTKSESSEVAPQFVPDTTVQQELNLSLVEVTNQKKYQNGLNASQFNGSLSTNQGVIESLSVSLPGGENVSVAFAEMSGNVFEYDLNGNIYSALMFQVDQNSYVVTLTNGPLEGTRLRFSSQNTVDQQEILAENNVQSGSFGSDSLAPETLTQNDQELQQEAIAAQAFNFGNSQAL